MKKHQVNFFATKADLESLLRVIEIKQELQFVRAGLFDVPIENRALTLLDSSLGIAAKGDNNQETRYLIANRLDSIQIRAIKQNAEWRRHEICRRPANQP